MNGNNFNGPGTSLSERLGINERPLDLLSYNNGLFRALDKQAVIKTPEKSKPSPGPEPDPRLKTPFYVENIGTETNTFGIGFDIFQSEPRPFTFEISEDGQSWAEYTIGDDDGGDDSGRKDPGAPPFMREFTDRLYIRAKTISYSIYDETTGGGYNIRMSCMNSFNVGGNSMSLLYGSEFTGNETSFPEESTWTFYKLFSSPQIVSAENLILPATTLAEGCYDNMFSDCTSLTSSPQLPATILSAYCYEGMFAGCTNLTTAPELPATTLVEGCYYYMFAGCESLESVTIHIEGEWNAEYTEGWLDSVAEEGILYNLGHATNIPENDSAGCPEGWEIKTEKGPEPEPPEPPDPETLNWFYVENMSNSDNTLTVLYETYNNFNNPIRVEYSYDKVNWNSKTINYNDTTLEVSFSSNSKIYLRTNVQQLSNSPMRGEGYCTIINCTGNYSAGGNIMSLVYGSSFTGEEIKFRKSSYANFYSLFYYSNTLISINDLILPATILTEDCYKQMFMGCTALNSIVCYADDISAPNCLAHWLDGVAQSGTFYNYGSATYTTGVSGIPEGWVITTYNPNKTYSIGDTVLYQGIQYIAIQDVPTNENNQVTDNWDTYWNLYR